MGPVSEAQLKALQENGTIKGDGLVWKKGFDNWKRLSEVGTFQGAGDDIPDIPPLLQEGFDWESVDSGHRIFSIKTGLDRNSSQNKYGPFSVDQLKQFFDEKKNQRENPDICHRDG